MYLSNVCSISYAHVLSIGVLCTSAITPGTQCWRSYFHDKTGKVAQNSSTRPHLGTAGFHQELVFWERMPLWQETSSTLLTGICFGLRRQRQREVKGITGEPFFYTPPLKGHLDLPLSVRLSEVCVAHISESVWPRVIKYYRNVGQHELLCTSICS